MGNCCGKKAIPCENESENFIREVFSELKLRAAKFHELKEFYDEKVRPEVNKMLLAHKENPKEMTQGRLFKFFKDFLYEEKEIDNHYKFYHSHVFDYECSEVLEEQPDFFFFVYVLSMIDGNKPDIIEKILKSEVQCDYEGFKHFLHLYLDINLLRITKRLDLAFKESFFQNQRKDVGSSSNHFDYHVITSSFLASWIDLEKHIYNPIKVKRIYETILKKFNIIVLGLNTANKKLLKGAKITSQNILDLCVEFPWLFDVDKLRAHLYTNRSNL
jgi:hypothetical protein